MALSAPAADPGWSRPETPFHAGELAIQARLGIQQKIDVAARRALRDYMPDQHRIFFGQLPFVLLGAVDGAGQPWASILAGVPGFMSSPDSRTLEIDALPSPGDPLWQAVQPGVDVGLLGIELPTRRRNRLNGTVRSPTQDGFVLAVGQSFGNCPQYIQTRAPHAIDPLAEPAGAPVHATTLSAADRTLIGAADTFFIATANLADAGAGRGVDVSHRGGRPGFVRVDDERTLTTPDFVGNFLFNTLGNLAVEPRAGLLFIDWANGDLLHLAGEAEVIWDGPDLRAFAGAERLVRLHVRHVVRRPAALPLRFSEPGFSPLLARTGDWESAARALEAEHAGRVWRPFQVESSLAETVQVRSIRLVPADGGGVAAYQPGQHLPIRITPPDGSAPLLRRYTISDAPDGRSYRLSVKREGEASTWLHALEMGARIEALAPRGDFVFDGQSRRPAVFVSAGIGITPVLAMLNALLVNEGRTRHHARLFFIHGARNGAEHAFAEHLRAKAATHANLTLHVRYSAPRPQDVLGRDHDSVGRVDIDLLRQVLPFDDYDFYLCGPGGFMQALYDRLRDLNVADDRIRFEAFGPASVRRRGAASSIAAAPELAADEAVEVVFARSGRRALWHAGSLLELAEQTGLHPEYSCRAGLCGTCTTGLVAGAVDYAEPPVADAGEGRVLICCATPHPGPHLPDSQNREGVTLDL